MSTPCRKILHQSSINRGRKEEKNYEHTSQSQVSAEKIKPKHFARQEPPALTSHASEQYFGENLACIPRPKPNRLWKTPPFWASNSERPICTNTRKTRKTRKKHPHIKPGPRPTRETEILQLIVLLDLRAVVLSREDLGDGEPVRVSAGLRKRRTTRF